MSLSQRTLTTADLERKVERIPNTDGWVEHLEEGITAAGEHRLIRSTAADDGSEVYTCVDCHETTFSPDLLERRKERCPV